MRGGARLLCLLACIAGGASLAQEVTTSLRPMPRPSAAPTAQNPAADAPVRVTMIRPRPRPFSAMTEVLPPLPKELAAVLPVLRPMARPASWVQATPISAASAPAPDATPEVRPERRGGLFGGLFGRRKPQQTLVPADGYVCGDRDIRGEELAPITSGVRGCGIDAPVRVTEVDGIRLTTPATINCQTARALKTWVNDAMRPAFARNEVVGLRIAASYICRPRNNLRGAKVSEHGRGNAVDISGFLMADGREWSIAGDYNRTIRRAHKSACGIFGTTLGPGSDGYHEDHLHFDVANLDRPYCR